MPKSSCHKHKQDMVAAELKAPKSAAAHSHNVQSTSGPVICIADILFNCSKYSIMTHIDRAALICCSKTVFPADLVNCCTATRSEVAQAAVSSQGCSRTCVTRPITTQRKLACKFADSTARNVLPADRCHKVSNPKGHYEKLTHHMLAARTCQTT